MKVLVTGVTGLLGNNIARVLLSRGRAVRGLTRSRGPSPALDGLDVELVRGDVRNPESVRAALRGCGAVIHAAAETRQWPTALRHYEDNIVGTRGVLEAAAAEGVERFVHVSTVNVFLRGTKESPGTEEREFGGGPRTPGYVQSKILAQRLVLEAARAGRVPALVVNPSFMIGPHDYKPSSGRLIVSSYRKRFLPVPPGGRNFVHVRDAAEAAVNALERGRLGECYILAHENLTYGEFFDALGEAAGRRARQIPLPAAALKAFGAVSGLLVPSHTPLDRANTRWLCAGHYFSPAKAVRELAQPQTPVLTAVAEAAEWFRQKGYLK